MVKEGLPDSSDLVPRLEPIRNVQRRASLMGGRLG
jgi:hypothetical protein